MIPEEHERRFNEIRRQAAEAKRQLTIFPSHPPVSAIIAGTALSAVILTGLWLGDSPVPEAPRLSDRIRVFKACAGGTVFYDPLEKHHYYKPLNDYIRPLAEGVKPEDVCK
jgi:hypothetical protein